MPYVFTHPQTFRAGDVRWYHWDIYVPSLEFPAKVPGGMDYTVDSFHDKRSSGVGSYVVFNIMNNRGPVIRVHLLPGILQYEATPLLARLSTALTTPGALLRLGRN